MAEPDSGSRPPLGPRRFALPRLQFSMWWLMVVVTIAAVCLGLGAVVGGTIVWIVFSALVLCILPTPLVIGALMGRGDVRAFSIGALVPWIRLWLDMPAATGGSFFSRALFATIFVLLTGTICGIVGVATRRWLERRAL